MSESKRSSTTRENKESKESKEIKSSLADGDVEMKDAFTQKASSHKIYTKIEYVEVDVKFTGPGTLSTTIDMALLNAALQGFQGHDDDPKRF